MIWLAAIVALFGAGANALGTLLQKLSASDPDPSQLFSRKFIKAMVTHKLWLGGVAFDFLGFLLQATALYVGSLVVVEPILTVDLVILFLIAHYRFGAKAGSNGWAGVLLVCVGLAAFLIATNPSGGKTAPGDWSFFGAILFVAAVVFSAALLMKTLKSDKTRIITGALATGLNFSLAAIFTKLAMTDLSHGVGTMLADWPIYALIGAAASAVVIMQSTYASGSLKLSQPIIAIVGPVCSVFFGVFLFSTYVRTGWPYLLAESASAAVIITGVILLAGSKSISSFTGSDRL